MPTSVRLDDELESLVEVVSAQTGQSKSEVIRAGVRAYCENALHGNELTHYDALKAFLEKPVPERGAGVPTDLGRNGERYLRERFAAKRDA